MMILGTNYFCNPFSSLKICRIKNLDRIKVFLLEHTGLEPVASTLPVWRAPNCANAPNKGSIAQDQRFVNDKFTFQMKMKMKKKSGVCKVFAGKAAERKKENFTKIPAYMIFPFLY
jgi:hypothetical protein